ncbi:MAG: hypothetical protein KAR35_05095 [Candidatus Heimdallarchaeota archaeon]|nr:hypothetical protein [Candidatus Heimdallarchaeota archaeon]MCK5048733.1 hypothetical protein [Candidatus Heimdallarchaeota archaeon]
MSEDDHLNKYKKLDVSSSPLWENLISRQTMIEIVEGISDQLRRFLWDPEKHLQARYVTIDDITITSQKNYQFGQEYEILLKLGSDVGNRMMALYVKRTNSLEQLEEEAKKHQLLSYSLEKFKGINLFDLVGLWNSPPCIIYLKQAGSVLSKVGLSDEIYSSILGRGCAAVQPNDSIPVNVKEELKIVSQMAFMLSLTDEQTNKLFNLFSPMISELTDLKTSYMGLFPFRSKEAIFHKKFDEDLPLINIIQGANYQILIKPGFNTKEKAERMEDIASNISEMVEKEYFTKGTVNNSISFVKNVLRNYERTLVFSGGTNSLEQMYPKGLSLDYFLLAESWKTLAYSKTIYELSELSIRIDEIFNYCQFITEKRPFKWALN